MHTCIHTHTHTHTHIYIYIYIFIYHIYMHIYIYIYLYVYMYTYIHIYTYIDLYIYLSLSIYVCACVCQCCVIITLSQNLCSGLAKVVWKSSSCPCRRSPLLTTGVLSKEKARIILYTTLRTQPRAFEFDIPSSTLVSLPRLVSPICPTGLHIYCSIYIYQIYNEI